MMVAGAWILGERLHESRALLLRDFLQEHVREDNFQGLCAAAFLERIGRVGMAVGIGEIGLDVVDGGLVGQVRAGDIENGTVLCMEVHFYELYAGKTDRVRAERRARREDPHARFTAELRGRDGGRKLPVFNAVKVPEEPQMTPAVNPAQEIRVPVGWLEDNFGNQVAGQARLARDTEFGREIRVNAGNVVHGRPPVVACDYHNTSAEKCKFLLHFLKNGVK